MKILSATYASLSVGFKTNFEFYDVTKTCCRIDDEHDIFQVVTQTLKNSISFLLKRNFHLSKFPFK